MEQKINPSNLGFWTLAIKYFHFVLAIFQKRWIQVKLGEFERRIKKISLDDFFCMMEQKIDPPNLAF